MSNGEIIYLDNAATTFPKPESVYVEMDRVNRNLAINAGRGSYALAKQANHIIEETRKNLLDLVDGRRVAEVVLSASATVALNQIIGGMSWQKSDVVYVTPYEHNAVMRPLYQQQQKYGFTMIELPLLENTYELDMEKTAFLFSQSHPSVVFATQISNVIGYIVPMEQLTELAKEYQAVVVMDASQSLGLLNINLQQLPVDYVVFAGHKNLYGPFGSGGFYMRKGLKLDTYIAGGTGSDSLNLAMPQNGSIRFEASSPNIVAIAGLHAALDEIQQAGNKDKWMEQEKGLTQRLLDGLRAIKNIKLYAPTYDSHIGIVAFNVARYQSGDIGMILDEDYNIAVRTGYHCAPLIHKALKDEAQLGVVRASIGRYTTEQDVDRLIHAIDEIVG